MDISGAERTTSHDVPLNHLDFKYIENCDDVKEVEKIVKILRSGDEGKFVELEKCAEKRLEKLAPNSKVLRKSTPVIKREYLDKDKRTEIEEDVENWSAKMSAKDKELKSSNVNNKTELPGVRGQGLNVDASQKKNKKSKNGGTKNPMPRSHRDWDKFDIDAELARVDSDDSKRVAPSGDKNQKLDLTDSLVEENLTDEEKTDKAVKEKDKGNEAFTAGDYDEAVLYYTRSLSLIPTIAARNNRAQTYIKQQKWAEAIQDCTHVLKTERGNTKALMRRAVAYQGTKEYKKAKADLQYVLEKESHNKRAQTLLEEVNSSLQEIREKGFSMKIEEGAIEDDQPSEKPLKTPPQAERPEESEETSRLFDQLKKLNDEKSSMEQKVIEQQKHADEQRKILADKQAEVESLRHDIDSIAEDLKNTKLGAEEKPRAAENKKDDDMPNDVNELKVSGNELFKQGQYGEAEKVYSKAIAKLEKISGSHNKNLALLLSNRAACLTKVGDCEGCVRDCTRALDLDDSCIKALIRRAAAYEAMEKYRKAYIEHQLILSVLPQQDTALQGINRCATMLQQLDGAKWRDKLPKSTTTITLPTTTPTRQQATPTPPVNQKSKEKMFEEYKAAGNNHVKMGRYHEAITSYAQCIEVSPDKVVPYTNRALCFLKLKQSSNVISDCTTALGLEVNNVKALYRRAQAYRLSEDYTSSVKDLEDLLKVQPNNNAAKQELKEVLEIVKQQSQKTKKKRIEIEEVDSSDEEPEPGKGELKNKVSASRSVPKSTDNKRNYKLSTTSTKKETSRTYPKVNVTSPYEFIQQWNSMKSTNFTDEHVRILRQIEPKLLPKMITKMLDISMLSIILQCVTEFIKLDESSRAYGILENLTRVARFNMVIMFMTDNDKNELNKCFDHLQQAADCPVLIEDLKKLKKQYSL